MAGGSLNHYTTKALVAPLCFASPRPNVSGRGCLVDGLGGEIPVCLSPTGCHSSGHEQAAVLQGLPAASDSSLLANKAVVSGPKAVVNPPSVAASTSVVSAQTASVAQVSQEPPVLEPACLLAEESTGGLDEEIQRRIDNPHRQSTSKVYSGKWEIFQKWCDNHEVSSLQPDVKTLRRFFLYLFKEKGLQPGTIQGYRRAISNKLYDSVQWDISHDSSLTRLIDSFFRDRPVLDRALPPWDLRVVLQSLTQAPFEPMALAPLSGSHLRLFFWLHLPLGKGVVKCTLCYTAD